MGGKTSVQELLLAGNQLQVLIKSVEDAPFEILTLSNDFQNLVLIISPVGRRGLDEDQNVLFTGILKSSGSEIRKARELVDEMCRVYSGGDFKSKRRRWIRHRGSVIAVLQEMKCLRISLAAAISTVVL